MNDVFLLVGRSLRTYLRQPAALIPNTAISVFFLFVYNAGLSSVSELPGFQGSYLAFILPVAIVSAAIGGASIAGDALVRDSESGYFTKLLLTPTQRLAIIWGPMIAGGIILVAQVTLIIVIALFMGLTSATGPLGYLVIIGFAFLWGMAFSGYSVWFALRTRSGAATQAATLVFFPLIFLSSTFVPEQYITAEWLKVATKINPTTYVFDAMRAVLIDGWVASTLLIGLAVMLASATLTGGLALWQARRSTKLTG
jgi:ABC-2 type transport system permease protein